MSARSDLFSSFGTPAKQKLILFGSVPISSEKGLNWLRSLNIEHVSLADLMRLEISRGSSFGSQIERTSLQESPLADETALALLRRWFWARKPDAGFALNGIPATLLQAKVFDEWLDARDENLDGVLVDKAVSAHPVAKHYRTLGLVTEDIEFAAA